MYFLHLLVLDELLVETGRDFVASPPHHVVILQPTIIHLQVSLLVASRVGLV